MADEKGQKVNRLELPLEFILPLEVPVVFADSVLLQASDVGVTLSFFQARPPIMIAGEPATATKSIPTVCIARLVLPFKTAERLMGMLNANIANTESKQDSSA